VRRVARRPLDQTTLATLAGLTREVRAATDYAAKAQQLWEGDRKAKKHALRAVRKALEAMASGRSRCMYCEDSLGTDIEHFYPKARYPLKAFSWPNHLLACSHCNSNLKRDQFPFYRRRPALIDPSVDEPAKHLAFLPSTGEFHAIDHKGGKSIEVFGLNDAAPPRKLPEARKGAFLKLQLLLEEYENCLVQGDASGADLAKNTVINEPFSAVLGWLVTIAAGPAASLVLRPHVPAIVARHDVAQWL
jgi:uncharacterized protein (TIGR02646 family)